MSKSAEAPILEGQMTTRPPSRSAIIGTGFMGQVHARAIRSSGAQLVGVTSSSAHSAARAAARLRTGVFASVEELLSDETIDVVHICTPNTTHAELVLATLTSGKHVVCEKPLATAPKDAWRIQLAAAETGRKVAVPFVYRFHPMVREAAARIRSGALGQVHSVVSSYLQDWLLDSEDNDWRVDPRLGGPSRAFADIGSHLCDLLEFVLGERLVRLSARTRTVRTHRNGHPVETEDLAGLLFETGTGTIGTAVVSQMAPGRKNRLAFEVMGTTASVAFDQESPDNLWFGLRQETRILTRDAAVLDPDAARLSVLPAGHPMGYQDAFNAFVADAYCHFEGGDPFGLPTSADGLRAVMLTAAVLSSAQSGQWVEIPDAGPAGPAVWADPLHPPAPPTSRTPPVSAHALQRRW